MAAVAVQANDMDAVDIADGDEARNMRTLHYAGLQGGPVNSRAQMDMEDSWFCHEHGGDMCGSNCLGDLYRDAKEAPFRNVDQYLRMGKGRKG